MSKFIFVSLVVIFFSSNVFAQSSSTVFYNPKIDRTLNSVADTLLLPFIDDFSNSIIYPKTELWSDSDVYINTNFAKNPPTIGVATFDGSNKFGNPYNNTNASATGIADELTSNPINTFDDGSGNVYNPTDGLFFSFFYEQKGFGDRPEPNDQLSLQFYNPDTGTWTVMWAVTGTAAGLADTTFTRVQITINDAAYFKKGFRFRFRNFGSLTGNVDHWHVDYVMLKPPPNFAVINDAAYMYPATSLLNGLTAMPYTHYKSLASPSAYMRDNSNYKITNNSSLSKIAGFVDEIFDPAHNSIFCNGCTIGSNNFQLNAQSNFLYNFPFSSFEFPAIATQDSAEFEIINHMESNTGGALDDNPSNDTIHYFQKFINYYAYDDGSAELGFNLNGAGAALASKFQILRDDTLRAVQFFFSQIGTSVANELFRIVVWDELNGKPNNIVYQKPNQIPFYANSINGFVSYNTQPIFLPAGNYFFGYIQTNNITFNLGLDANTITDASKTLINVNGSGWTNFNISGSWMIRPVFSQYPLNVGFNEMLAGHELSVYPNPASSTVTVGLGVEGKKCFYEITDVSGRIVCNGQFISNMIDVKKTINGFYFLKIYDAKKSIMFQQKIIIQH